MRLAAGRNASVARRAYSGNAVMRLEPPCRQDGASPERHRAPRAPQRRGRRQRRATPHRTERPTTRSPCVTLARAQPASRGARARPAGEHAHQGTRRAQRSEHGGPRRDEPRRGSTPDDADRGWLREVATDGVVTEHYEYDANGNRTLGETQGNAWSGVYDAQDRLLSYGPFTYTYTPDGALHTKTDTRDSTTTTYIYDALGNLVHVDLPMGDTIDYLVDGEGRRSKRDGGRSPARRRRAPPALRRPRRRDPRPRAARLAAACAPSPAARARSFRCASTRQPRPPTPPHCDAAPSRHASLPSCLPCPQHASSGRARTHARKCDAGFGTERAKIRCTL